MQHLIEKNVFINHYCYLYSILKGNNYNFYENNRYLLK